jgi:hypothetical protein
MGGLASKSLGRFSLVWPQNRRQWFSLVWPQNWWLGFPGLSLKTESSCLVIWAIKSLQQFLGLDLKTKQAWFVGCATKPMEGGWHRTRVEICWLASPEASHARVFQSGLKTGGSTTAGGACCIIVEVASGSS